MQLVSFFVEVYIREKVRWLSQWPANVFLKNEEHNSVLSCHHIARYSPQLPRQSSRAILSFNCDGNAFNNTLLIRSLFKSIAVVHCL